MTVEHGLGEVLLCLRRARCSRGIPISDFAFRAPHDEIRLEIANQTVECLFWQRVVQPRELRGFPRDSCARSFGAVVAAASLANSRAAFPRQRSTYLMQAAGRFAARPTRAAGCRLDAPAHLPEKFPLGALPRSAEACFNTTSSSLADAGGRRYRAGRRGDGNDGSQASTSRAQRSRADFRRGSSSATARASSSAFAALVEYPVAPATDRDARWVSLEACRRLHSEAGSTPPVASIVGHEVRREVRRRSSPRAALRD